jgi:DNA-binding MarR family transcriptional regulator
MEDLKTIFSEDERERFMDFVDSLKLVRKANLEDATTGESLIDTLYSDLLPNNGIINKLNLPNTTIVSGRKGTGKSTIFQKSINEVITKEDVLCIYIDVKSLVDNTTLPKSYQAESLVLSSDEIRKYLTYVEFLKIIITETKRKIYDKLSSKNLFERLFNNNTHKFERVIEKLDNIEENVNEVFKTIDRTLLQYVKEYREDKKDAKLKNEFVLKADPSFNVGSELASGSTIKKEFQNTIETYLDIRRTLINNLVAIRDHLKLKYIYIYLDDFSEIEKEGQEFFMNWFVTPLNNLSENFIKFKIATYPHRFYEGELEPGKYDLINLDFFDAYYTQGNQLISKMETFALDYTKRLLDNRFRYYFKDIAWQKYFAMSKDELSLILFQVSLNVTRKIGFILSYCYETSIIHDVPITKDTIRKASERYFHEVTEKYFKMNPFVKRPFNDKISIENQHGLLKEIISHLSSNKKKKIKHYSHFIVNEEFCYLLDNLNLNGYLSTYNQIKDKNNHNLTVYSLDYGLCVQHSIKYEKPGLTGIKEINEANIDSLIIKYFNNTQAIKCTEGHEFEYNLIGKFKNFRMKCPKCLDLNKISSCEVISIDKELLLRLKQIEEKQKDPINYSEFTVLEYMLNKENSSLSINNITEHVDRSHRTVEKILDALMQKELVALDKDASSQLGKKLYRLTEPGGEMIRKFLTDPIQQKG